MAHSSFTHWGTCISYQKRLDSWPSSSPDSSFLFMYTWEAVVMAQMVGVPATQVGDSA